MNPDASARRSPIRTLSEHLAQQVIDLIRSDELQPGSRLPSVKEMAGLFSVAPPTMREALRQLEITGIIDIRHGSGIYVLQNERPMMIANPYRGELERDTIADLFEARSVLEPALAEMAAQHTDDAAIARLRTLIDSAEMYLAGDDSTDLKLGEINMQFHRGIAAGANNSVLAQVMASISELHIKAHLAVLDLHNDRRRDHQQHKVILSAIESRDPSGARDAMAQHIADVWSVIQARL